MEVFVMVIDLKDAVAEDTLILKIYLDNCSCDDQEQNLLRERFDYTEWRKKYFADTDLETFLNEAEEYDKAHPFRGGK